MAKDNPIPITPDEMESYADVLQSLVDAHRQFAKWMRDKEIKRAEITHFKTATDAIDGLARFAGAAAEAIFAHSLTDGPLEPLSIAVQTPAMKARFEAKTLAARRDQYYQAMRAAMEQVQLADEIAEHQATQDERDAKIAHLPDDELDEAEKTRKKVRAKLRDRKEANGKNSPK